MLKLFKHFWSATGYACQGLWALFKTELAFQVELLVLVVLLPTACWVGHTPLSRAILVFVVLLVLIVEVINSSIEAVVDRVGAEHHALSGKAKDMAAAAVLLAIINAIIVWSIYIVG